MSAEIAAAVAAAPVINPHVTPLLDDHLDSPDYTPAKLLNTMLERFSLKNDAALSRALKLPPPVISKIRLKHASVTPAILLRMHDVTGWSISDLRALLGVKPAVAVLPAL